MLTDSILKSFKGKNILVTGGTGLVGRQVVEVVRQTGAQVTVVSLDRIEPTPHVQYQYGDLCSFEFCKSITKNVDHVFHLAGIKGSVAMTIQRPASFFVPLLMMNTNILEACRLNKVSKVLYTSSIGAYAAAEVFRESEIDEKQPMDHYPGWAKRMAELQIKAYNIQYRIDHFAVVRLCNVYGPGDNFDSKNAMVIPALMARIHSKEDPLRVWGDGSAIRDFAYSRDVAKGIILALHHGTEGRYVNLGGGQETSIKTLVETLREITPFNYEFDTSKSAGFPRRVMDISLARKMFGYNPQTSIREGLSETWKWFTQHVDEHKQKKNYFAENAA